MTHYDVAIIGAGIAGASLAAELSPGVRVLLLEAEAQPGYHATGRSAAFWCESYGGPDVLALTRASHDFLANPPTDFSGTGFLNQRGALHIGRSDDAVAMAAFHAQCLDNGIAMTSCIPSAYLPDLRPDWSLGLWEPSCADIDVGGLHAAYLRAARRGNVTLVCNAGVEQAVHGEQGWQITTRAGSFHSVILVNAAGAWADDIAQRSGVRPLGIKPCRRTMVQLRMGAGIASDLPLTIDISGQLYFKPEPGGRLWLTPHDENPVEPCDVAAEDMDVALAIDRLESVMNWDVAAVERKWAGLRSFAPDRLPVYGFDPVHPGFFWCAGQGGFGIQTAPAAAKMAAALLLGHVPTYAIQAINPLVYAPIRFVI